MDAETLKAQAAQAALQAVSSGMRIGIGTGTTVRHFVDQLGARLAEGSLRDVAGVPTSVATANQCQELKIPLTTLSEAPVLDLAVDGTDEVTPELDLIKGLGGALLREKMVASSARRFVVIADDRKRVSRLGTKAPLPVEVVPFEWQSHLPFLRELGANPRLRMLGEEALITDNGNYILDCDFAEGIDDPRTLDHRLLHRPGIVEHGLFLGLCRSCAIATSAGIEMIGDAL